MDETTGPVDSGSAPGVSAGAPGLFTLPNLLSLSRVLLTPVFVVLVVKGRLWEAFFVFLIAGATDALDGLAARALHLKSALGLWLDPIGDKVLLTSAFVVLTLPSVARPNVLPLWLTALCVGRDVAIALAAMVIMALRGRRTFKPVLSGKASTICQVFLLYAVLYFNAAGQTPGFLAWFYVMTALLTAGSFVQYCFIGVRMLRDKPAPPAV